MRGQLRSEQREAALDYRRTDRSVCGLARSSCVATSISSVSANQGSESGLRLRMFSVVATERTRAEWTLGKAPTNPHPRTAYLELTRIRSENGLMSQLIRDGG